MQTDANTVYIEHCIGCSSHAWCTSHEASKYIQYYDACASAIQTLCPGLTVVQNQIPQFITSRVLRSKAQPWTHKPSHPRIGAFEVYFQDRVLFSKLEHGLWPHPGALAKRIREVIDQPKLPSVTRAANSSSIALKQRKHIFRAKNNKSVGPAIAKVNPGRAKSTTPRTKAKGMKKVKVEEKENKNDEEYSDEFQDGSEGEENELTGGRKISKVYELKLAKDILSNKVCYI
jgi:predicted Rdx family selenoprotein